jgi:NAD(P)-dependent dehydrogenase (short-subunit alcohol dehydrogenase family)
MFSLHSKVALVTGAGRGIGRAIALQLAAAGASVTVNDLDPEPLEETRAAIGGTSFAGDLTDPAFPQQLVENTIRNSGGLDIIVNNAGYTWDNVIQKTTDEQFQAMLDIHVVAPFAFCVPPPATYGNPPNVRPRKEGACSARWSTSLRSPEPMAAPGRQDMARRRRLLSV